MNAELGAGGGGGLPRGLPVWPHCETLSGAKAALQTEIQFGRAAPLTRLEDFSKTIKGSRLSGLRSVVQKKGAR